MAESESGQAEPEKDKGGGFGDCVIGDRRHKKHMGLTVDEPNARDLTEVIDSCCIG